MNKPLIIIPARLASTRLPSKPLCNIKGKSMIQRVYQQAKKVKNAEVIVACDCLEIKNEIEKIGGRAIITDPNLPSGTDRIFAATKEIANIDDFKFVINLQGDLPLVNPEIIKDLTSTMQDDSVDIATLACLASKEEAHDSNIVKIAINFTQANKGRALYFSRSPIPYGRDNETQYYHHIGIYAYKIDILQKFVSLPESNLEKIEKLEQLRALENNIEIIVNIIEDKAPISVDTKKDLESVIKLLQC
jgi:3-deoxy-manno-octulosonate cytidylyltransferase (CMP-KDO synthetase)